MVPNTSKSLPGVTLPIPTLPALSMSILVAIELAPEPVEPAAAAVWNWMLPEPPVPVPLPEVTVRVAPVLSVPVAFALRRTPLTGVAELSERPATRVAELRPPLPRVKPAKVGLDVVAMLCGKLRVIAPEVLVTVT